MMTIPDLLNAPWAILPEVLEEIHAIYQRRIYDQPVDQAAIEQLITSIKAARSRPFSTSVLMAQSQSPDDDEEPPPYEIINGVAVIPVMGTISRRMNLFSYISGGVSTELLLRNINAALADPAVLAILLLFDSPGGAVGGLQVLADRIFAARAIKPITAFATDVMASAAYWIGSSASFIMAETTSNIGSIGVITMHADYSRQDEARGVKRTYLSAGAYKALGNNAEPLSELARSDIQGRLDHYYSLFVDTVARNRGTDTDTVLRNMADGRQFIGSQALTAGLVDKLGTLDDAIEATLARVETKKPQFFRR